MHRPAPASSTRRQEWAWVLLNDTSLSPPCKGRQTKKNAGANKMVGLSTETTTLHRSIPWFGKRTYILTRTQTTWFLTCWSSMHVASPQATAQSQPPHLLMSLVTAALAHRAAGEVRWPPQGVREARLVTLGCAPVSPHLPWAEFTWTDSTGS